MFVGGGVVEGVPVFGRDGIVGTFAVVGGERLAVFVVEDCPAFAPLFFTGPGVVIAGFEREQLSVFVVVAAAPGRLPGRAERARAGLSD